MYLQLLPEWTPSRRPLARFDALVKVAAGSVLERPSEMELRLLDQAGRVAGLVAGLLDPTQSRMVGPDWRRISGRLLKIDDQVEHAEGVVAGVRSKRVSRSDAEVPLLLVPVACQIGMTGEPHLWWRFWNQGAEPIHLARIRQSTVLRLDKREYHPQVSYDGPALLPPQRGVSGLWSLDDLDSSARRGTHRLGLAILGVEIEEFSFSWGGR